MLLFRRSVQPLVWRSFACSCGTPGIASPTLGWTWAYVIGHASDILAGTFSVSPLAF